MGIYLHSCGVWSIQSDLWTTTARINTHLDRIKSLEISQPFKCFIRLSPRITTDYTSDNVRVLFTFLFLLADQDLNESFFVVLASVWRGRGKGPLFVIFLFTLAYIYISISISISIYLSIYLSIYKFSTPRVFGIKE